METDFMTLSPRHPVSFSFTEEDDDVSLVGEHIIDAYDAGEEDGSGDLYASLPLLRPAATRETSRSQC
jgi:hypothetical protein